MTEAKTVYTPPQAAEYLCFAVTTLAVWRTEGRGPVYTKAGRNVRYRRADMDRWLDAGPAGQRAMDQASECHSAANALAKRARGRVGAAARERRLAAQPFCEDCLAHGDQRTATEIDHIIPIALGGSDDDDNIRCLCNPCHRVRTKEQFAQRAARE